MAAQRTIRPPGSKIGRNPRKRKKPDPAVRAAKQHVKDVVDAQRLVIGNSSAIRRKFAAWWARITWEIVQVQEVLAFRSSRLSEALPEHERHDAETQLRGMLECLACGAPEPDIISAAEVLAAANKAREVEAELAASATAGV